MNDKKRHYLVIVVRITTKMKLDDIMHFFYSSELNFVIRFACCSPKMIINEFTAWENV